MFWYLLIQQPEIKINLTCLAYLFFLVNFPQFYGSIIRACYEQVFTYTNYTRDKHLMSIQCQKTPFSI